MPSNQILQLNITLSQGIYIYITHGYRVLRLTFLISVEGKGGAPEAKEQKRIFGWPVALGFIVFTEFCERFCYYGMRSKRLDL